ncbi:SpoIIE family protein phosphatase [bacterium]|nr:SpoIIE family protein phosphatase [bacterium]
MKLKQRIFFLTAAIAFVLDFIYIIVQRTLSSGGAPEGDIFHTFLVLIMLLSLGYAYFRLSSDHENSAVQLIGRTVIAITIYLLIIGIVQLSAMTDFQSIRGVVQPASYSTLVVAAVISGIGAIASVIVFASLTRLIFVKRRQKTKRNFIILLVLGGLTIIFEFLGSPNGVGLGGISALSGILLAITIMMMIVNAFRFSWILSLTRREKIINLLLSLVGFVFFIILSIYASGNEALNKSLLYYHPMLQQFVELCFIFGAIYMGIGFTSTLLHLPTAKEFDRKQVELSSLQNMSRLITQVFDFDELVATTTHLALEVSEGDAAWLELLSDEALTRPLAGNAKSGTTGDAVRSRETTILRNSLKNIDPESIAKLRRNDGSPLQSLAFETANPVLIQDFHGDRRVSAEARSLRDIGTLLIAPLSRHGEIIGLLCVTKRKAYEFDRDIMNVLYAFADMVSVALENSSLIRESIQKERMVRELQVAHEMQRSLLPQDLPSSPRFEIAAHSIPAYEVGGDYYDVLSFDDNRLGLLVGDVSGKGVSAALYMAQVKGIFQSLSGVSASTRDILIRMNGPLCNGMERKSFISLLYAVLHTEEGLLTFARAGHCPLLHVRDNRAAYLRPEGMALGLDPTPRFAESLEEETLRLAANDIVVMYSDGVTETRDRNDEEFEYQRLADCVLEHRDHSAQEILTSILERVQNFSGKQEADDDVTVLVLRWKNTL